MRTVLAVSLAALVLVPVGVRVASDPEPSPEPSNPPETFDRHRPHHHPDLTPGERLPVREGRRAPQESPGATQATSIPDTSIGILGPCEGISASVPVIRCAAAWAGIDYSEFLAVAQRESSLIPTAVSPTGCCKGLFQLHASYFAEWAQRYTDLRWFGGIVPSYFDPRANALVAAGMWADQGGPCPAWC